MNLFRQVDPTADEITREAITEHKPVKVYGMFSGGRDSLVAAHLASQQPNFAGQFHANTGIGIEKTREFVRQTCQQFGWPLVEIKSPQTYEWFIETYGFPGPSMHGYIYTYLKERCVEELIRRAKTSHYDRVMLVTGVRNDESRRRMGYDKTVTRKGAQVWMSPILYWSKSQRDAYIAEHNLPRNLIADALGMSGECLCGAFAGSRWKTPEAELDRIAILDPGVVEYIHSLERRAEACGKPCQWGYPPPIANEIELRTALEDEGQMPIHMPLCHNCVLQSGGTP